VISNDKPRKLFEKLHLENRFRPVYPHEQVIRWFNFCNFPAASKILDFGAGAGRHSIFFALNNMESFSSDISLNGLNYLDERAKDLDLIIKTQFHKVGCKIDYPANFFDGVLSFHVLYYVSVEEFKIMIFEIHRILKKRGKFMFTMRSENDGRRFEAYQEDDFTFKIPEFDANSQKNVEGGISMLFVNEQMLSNNLDGLFDFQINKYSSVFDGKLNDNFVVYCERI